MSVLLVHGAGSCPATARRLLAPLVTDRYVAPDVRGGTEETVAVVDALVREHRPSLLAGISLGAHALAVWAARTGATVPLALVMPAWTGAPDDVAAATSVAADDLAAHGRDGVLARLHDDPAARGDWVVAELARAWPTYTDAELVRALRSAAGSAGPGRDELRRVQAPTAVVALADDPLHPTAVAEEWARLIPGATITTVPRSAPGADPASLGRAAVEGLSRLSGSR